ncbi:hypothetical protein OUZ56_012332 [Daphnia magna]|uniref:Uncharacterized protein n=1 Tax=Daphnia magna TaxID=35525 RepID=A0ABQ9Z2P1_9CRUS|nr:hypothetical protein OUZ56_012332 [Daphnia magna]
MQTRPRGLSFTATPTGEAEQITLRQEKPDSPIKSPFGLLNTTQQEGQFIQNQNTIVWGERTTNSSYTQTLLKGIGYLEIPQTTNRITPAVSTTPAGRSKYRFLTNQIRTSYQ